MRPGSSRLLENILANYAYVFVMGVVTLVATPIYLHRLGSLQWGVVALCMTAQGFLLLLDAGLGQIMPREIARAAASGQAGAAYRVSVRLYGCIALGAFGLGQLAASLYQLIAAQAAGLPPGQMDAFRLVLLQFLFQFPNNAALAYWTGTEQQRKSNLRQAAFAATKHGLALLLVTHWQQTALAYMLPFATVSAAEFTLNWRRIRFDEFALRRDNAARLQAAREQALADGVALPAAPAVRALLASGSGFSVAVVIGMLTSQIDRLYLARTVSTEVFGTYVVAANLALALMHLQGPVQRAFLPRIVADAHAPWRAVRHMLGLIALVCLLPCVVLAALAEPLLAGWLHNPAIAHAGAPVFAMIALAVGLNGVYNGIYTLFIRDNLYARLIILNAFILACQATLLLCTVQAMSIKAGGASWLLGATLQVLFGFATLAHMHSKSRVR